MGKHPLHIKTIPTQATNNWDMTRCESNVLYTIETFGLTFLNGASQNMLSSATLPSSREGEMGMFINEALEESKEATEHLHTRRWLHVHD